MGTMKDLIYSIESKRDINSVTLSWRVYNRLSPENQKTFKQLYQEQPEYGEVGKAKKIRPLRQYIANFALWLYIKSKKQWSLKKCFRYAKRNLEVLLNQWEHEVRENYLFTIDKKLNLVAKQFLFHGFIPLGEYKPINPEKEAAYITSSMAIKGIIYIYPKKLRPAAKPGKLDKNHLWYIFESGIGIRGYTRIWYPQELKNLKRAQDDQTSSSK